ncbi:Type II restriction enzyme (Eco47II Sau96I) (fragment) [Vibrio nigripulchritudo MADA3029]
MPSVVNLGVGQLIDIVCDNKKIIAEIKNKHNTPKGSHMVAIYQDLARVIALQPRYAGY